MADSESKYADSFISQDMIDGLMKEAEDLGPEAVRQDNLSPANGGTDVDDDDVVSQDDIDSLLDLVGPKEEEAEGEEPELISQEDIDALLEGNIKKPDPSPVQEEEPDEDSTDLDLVTPEDIEKLLHSESPADPVDDAVPESEDDFEQISQDDLDALLEGTELNGGDGDDSSLGGEADDSLISQEDINALLSTSLNAESPSEAETPNAEKETPEVEKETPKAEKEINIPAAGKSVSDGDNAEEDLISQDDINRIVAEADNSEDSTDDDSNLISQDDIDSLIKGSIDDDQESDEETLITQEDIDRLLKMPEPGGIDESEPEESQAEVEQLVSQEDIDKLLNADYDDFDADLSGVIEDDSSDQVILEKNMDSIEDVRVQDKPKKNIRKIVISSVAAVLVLLVTGVSWMMFSGDPEDVVEKKPIAEVVPEEVEPDVPGDTPPQVVKEFVAVTMNDFLVPAPASMKGTAYIYVNMTIEIVDVSSNPIKDYEPFFRNIIYEVLNKALVLQNESKIVEADLKKMIKEALNDSLSEGYIAKIDFSEFKLG